MWLPGLSRIPIWLANRQLHRGHPDRALQTAERYLRLRPKDERAWWLSLDLMREASSRWSDTTDAARRAYELFPDSFEIAIRLSDSLLMSERYEEFEDLVDRLERDWPDEPRTLGWLLARALRNNDIDAAASLARRLRQDATIESDPSAMGAVAYTYLLTGRREEGIELLRQLVEEGTVAVAPALLGLVLQDDDPTASAMLLAKAHESWTPGVGAEFDDYVANAREMLAHPLARQEENSAPTDSRADPS